FRLVSRKTWLSVSAKEWAASASIELDPLTRPAAVLATAMARCAPSATSTVRFLSEAMRGLLPSDPALPPHPAGPVGVRDGLGREDRQQPGEVGDGEQQVGTPGRLAPLAGPRGGV